MDFFNTLYSEDDANSLYSKNTKEKFYDILTDEGFDFTNIDEETKLPKSLMLVIANDTETFNKFNIIITKLHKEKVVSILEAISYLVSDYIEAPVAIKCLDELNYITLKNELLKKFTVKSHNESKEISLLDFL